MNLIQQKSVDIGNGESLEIVEISGASSGPVVAVIGGVHGDEEEGVLSVRRLVRELKERQIAGTVRCLTVANPSAYQVRSRLSPIDNKNLAREFPGSGDGSVTQRAAHVITNEIITGADAMIDLHSAGINYAMPLFCGFFELGTACSRQSAKMARAFGSPIVWAHTQATEGRTLSAALALGVPAIYAECGGGGGVSADDTYAYFDGVINVLATLGLLQGESSAQSEQLLITDSGGDTDNAIESPDSGVAVTHVVAGDTVQEGDLLCEVYDEQGRVIGVAESPINGIVMLLRRTARIDKGETIAMLAPPPETWFN